MTTPSTCADSVASRSFMAGRPMTGAFPSISSRKPAFKSEATALETVGAEARVPDDFGPRGLPPLPDHAKHLSLVDLGEIGMLRTGCDRHRIPSSSAPEPRGSVNSPNSRNLWARQVHRPAHVEETISNQSSRFVRMILNDTF